MSLPENDLPAPTCLGHSGERGARRGGKLPGGDGRFLVAASADASFCPGDGSRDVRSLRNSLLSPWSSGRGRLYRIGRQSQTAPVLPSLCVRRQPLPPGQDFRRSALSLPHFQGGLADPGTSSLSGLSEHLRKAPGLQQGEPLGLASARSPCPLPLWRTHGQVFAQASKQASKPGRRRTTPCP